MRFVPGDAPAEAIAFAVLIGVILAAVQFHRRIHDHLLLAGEHLFLTKGPVPGEHVEYGGVQVIAAVQAVRSDHVRGRLFRKI